MTKLSEDARKLLITGGVLGGLVLFLCARRKQDPDPDSVGDGPRAPTPTLTGRGASPAFTPTPAGRGFIPPQTTPSFTGGGGVPSPGTPGTNVPPTGSGFPSSSPQPAPTGTPAPGATSESPSASDTFGLRFAQTPQAAVNPPQQQGRQTSPKSEPLSYMSATIDLTPVDRTPETSGGDTVDATTPSPFKRA